MTMRHNGPMNPPDLGPGVGKAERVAILGGGPGGYEAALVAANHAYGAKVEERLKRLGVGYERRDLLKPVMLRLARKVDPEELFPARSFPYR